jgi:hypothetical protein
MHRKELDETIEIEIKPAAKTYAEGIHETVSSSMVEGMNEAAAEVFDPMTLTEEDLVDLVLPALKSEVFFNLARLSADAAQGWAEVVERNLPDERRQDR